MKNPKYEYDNDQLTDRIQRELDHAFSAGVADADKNAKKTLRVGLVQGGMTPSLTATVDDYSGNPRGKFITLRRAAADAMDGFFMDAETMRSWAKEFRSIARMIDAHAADKEGK